MFSLSRTLHSAVRLWVLLEQIFTIDKERIKSFMGMTSEWEMAQIEKALKCSLALDRENMNQERGNLFG